MFKNIKQWGFSERRTAACIICIVLGTILFLWQGSGYVIYEHQNILQFELSTETKVYWSDSGGFVCDAVNHSCIELSEEQNEFVRSCIMKTFLFTRAGVYTFVVESNNENSYKYRVMSYCVATEAGTRRKWSM